MFKSGISPTLLWAFQQPLIRYLFVGMGLFFIDLIIFLTCNLVFCLTLEISQVTARSVGALAGFTGHKWFTFKNPARDRKKILGQGAGYFALTIFNIFFSAWLIGFLAGCLPNQLVLSKVLAEIILVSLTFCFLKLIFYLPRTSSHGSQ